MQAGYAVIFLYRKGSIQPFTKGLPSAQLLDILTDVLVDSEKADTGVHVRDEASAILQAAVRSTRECNEQGTLLRIPFITLFEYLQVIQQDISMLLGYQRIAPPKLHACDATYCHQICFVLRAVSQEHLQQSEAMWPEGSILLGSRCVRLLPALEANGAPWQHCVRSLSSIAFISSI